MNKHLTIFLGIFLLVVPYAQAFDIKAKAYVLMHPQSGMEILSKNADMQIAPASLTKMMTLYLLFKALQQDELTLQSSLSISKKAWKMEGSKMFVEVGKTVEVHDLIQGIAVSSGNDASIVAAEHLGGTEEAFVKMMNAEAKRLGMNNTVFKNATGWPDPLQTTTARDMAKLASAIWKDFPHYYVYFSVDEFTYSGIKQPNRNGLLHRDIGVDGIKTGHVDDAGYHLAASGEKNGVRLVSVVLGTESMQEREDESAKLLSYGFGKYAVREVIRRGTSVAAANVWLGNYDLVPLVAGEDLTLLLPKSAGKITAHASYYGPLKAPVKVGQKVGVLKVIHPEDPKKVWRVPLISGADVEKIGGFEAFSRKVKYRLGFN